jgi:hypothetical protein
MFVKSLLQSRNSLPGLRSEQRNFDSHQIAVYIPEFAWMALFGHCVCLGRACTEVTTHSG